VLGSVSAKSLRADRLHELIFHGSPAKKPSDYALVKLYLDNSGKVFPFDEEEVWISRRVNKQGMCIYKLMGRTRTRQQVLELLAMVGLRPDGYNIIHQGEVTRIIEMGPVERRLILDQISGITEYKEKRERAERELQRVEQRLKEAEIILNQRYEIFKRLEEEAKAAQRYVELQDRLKVLQASLAHSRVKKLEERLSLLSFQASQHKSLREELGKELRSAEQELRSKEGEMQLIMDKLLSLPERVRLERKATELKAQLEILSYKLKLNQREVKRLEQLVRGMKLMDAMPLAVKAILKLGLRGVHGVVKELLSVPKELELAIGVALGAHAHDVVVEDEGVAGFCIDLLKRKRIGRARFLPLNLIRPRKLRRVELLELEGVRDIASKLVACDEKFRPVVEHVLGDTLVVRDFDTAKRIGIGKARMVTLEGELLERSGAITGGYLRPRAQAVASYLKLKQKLLEENKSLEQRIRQIEAKLKECAELKPFGWKELEGRRAEVQKSIGELRSKLGKLRERKREVEERLRKLDISMAKVEVELSAAGEELSKYPGVECVEDSIPALKKLIAETQERLDKLGLVNLRAPQQFERVKQEFVGYRERYERICEERDAVLRMIEEIEQKRKEVFNSCLQRISKHFQEVYKELTGGEANLELEDPTNLESGLLIQASPAGKRLINIDLLSGGEKTLTALAFLFALQRYKPAPFYILDEVDAALDKENTRRLGEFLQKASKDAQFLVITHNDITVRYGDVVYGATLVDGETKLIGLEMPRA
jgi:chromosome segregation protein